MPPAEVADCVRWVSLPGGCKELRCEIISENSIVIDAQYCWSVSAINRAKADFSAYSKVYSVGTADGGAGRALP